jgi:colicin import membrane protein
MASAATLDLVPGTKAAKPSTDIVATVATNPGVVLLDRVMFDAWYDKLSAEAPTDVDISTNKGRDVVRSYAAKVRSEKAAIDKARLRLTEEWRSMTTQANAAGKEISTRLETLAVTVRAPLTEWEEAEKARENECRAVIEGMRAAKIIAEDDTADTVRTRGTEVYGTVLDADRFGDTLGEAQAVKADAIDTLKRALARLLQEEADRAELAKLRAEREEADRIAAEKLAAEEAERQRIEAERLAEERRTAAEKADAERIARAEQDAAERAQREAEQAAQAERDRVQREHDEALAIERARADAIEAAAQEERGRVEREKAETARRAEDQEHRTEVKRRAKEAIMSCGADEETARKIVIAVLANEIPNMKLEF